MPIQGTDAALATKMASDMTSKMAAKIGQPIAEPSFLKALCEAISETMIAHFVQNVMVEPGIPVATAGGPTAQVGATTGPGLIG